MLVLSRLSLYLKGTLTPNKPSQQPLTLTTRKTTDNSNTGISNAPWDLKSLNYLLIACSRLIFCRFASLISGHMDLSEKAQLMYNKFVSCSDSYCFSSLH